jgi:hypothetical protein
MVRKRFAPWLVTLVLASAVPMCAAETAVAETQFRTLYPVNQHISVEVPKAWLIDPRPSNSVLAVYPPDTRDVGITLYVHSHPVVPFSSLASETVANAHKLFRTEDPKASIRSRSVSLPVGKAEEVIVRERVERDGRFVDMVINIYVFLHGHRSYQFAYASAADRLAVYLPIFDRSVRSIRFTR